MATDLRSYIVDEFETAVGYFVNDLDALSHEDLSRSYDRGSRCAYDFVYEVGIINRRIATIFRGEDPGPMPWKFGEEWLKAPAEFCEKDAAKRHIQATADELISNIGDDLNRPVVFVQQPAPVYQRVIFAAMHTMYHDAQLNFIQSMAGDLAVHW